LRKSCGFPFTLECLRLCLCGAAEDIDAPHGKAQPFRKECGKAATNGFIVETTEL
jgi:hypothetical protein